MIDHQIRQTMTFGHGTCFRLRHAAKIGCGRTPVTHVPGVYRLTSPRPPSRGAMVPLPHAKRVGEDASGLTHGPYAAAASSPNVSLGGGGPRRSEAQPWWRGCA